MQNIVKVSLLLAAVVCISEAQFDKSGQQCLCQRVRNFIDPRSEVKDLQIYQATVFCDRVEIVITIKSGQRFCLNPKLKMVKALLAKILKRQITPTAKPTVFPSTPTHA